MKNNFVLAVLGSIWNHKHRIVCLGVLLCILTSWLGGCGYSQQPGETAAEGHRRHKRNLSINQQGLMQDIDKVILADEPSKLTDKRID